MFSLRNIFIGVVVLFLILGFIFSFIVARTAQTTFLNEKIREHSILVQSVGTTLFSSSQHVGTNGRGASPERIHEVLESIVVSSNNSSASGSGIVYFRFIEIASQQIVASSKTEENERYFSRLPQLPESTGGVVVNQSGNVMEITYRGSDSQALWLGLSRDAAISSITSFFVETLGLISIMIVIMGGGLFAIGFIFITNPLKKLTHALHEASRGNFSVHLPKSSGEFGRIFGIFNQMEQGIVSVRERDELISGMKSDFITTAAHQLRTPLSAVKWAIKMILDEDMGPLNIDQKAILMKGYESNDRMIRLVNDLLDVDRIDSGRLQYEFAPIDLINLIDSVIVVVTPRAVERSIMLDFPDREKKWPPIKADAEKLRQVIQNLLDNAVKYSFPGGKVRIGIEKRDGDMIAMSVTDNGIGIPKEQHQKIFGKFFRADNARKLQTDGSGLGLYIMQQIIKKHDGEVFFESEEGKGSTFTFTVPIHGSR